MFESIWQWIMNNKSLLFYLGLGSVATFLVTTFVVPLFIILLPDDYFTNDEKVRRFYKLPPPLLSLLVFLKNILGVIFILTGVILLVLPGQGLLTILMGVLLLDFPGKRQIELKVIGEKHILNGINWIREKFGKKPLLNPTIEDNKR